MITLQESQSFGWGFVASVTIGVVAAMSLVTGVVYWWNQLMILMLRRTPIFVGDGAIYGEESAEKWSRRQDRWMGVFGLPGLPIAFVLILGYLACLSVVAFGFIIVPPAKQVLFYRYWRIPLFSLGWLLVGAIVVSLHWLSPMSHAPIEPNGKRFLLVFTAMGQWAGTVLLGGVCWYSAMCVYYRRKRLFKASQGAAG